MKIRKGKIVLEKSHLYKLAICAALLSPLAGDVLSSQARVSVPAPKPAVLSINPDDWVSLAHAVEKRAARYPGFAGFIIKDFTSGQTVSANSDASFPSASLIKMPILCAAFQAVEDRRFSLNTPITLQKGDRRGGSGLLKFATAGTILTNRELLEAMIIHSDNTATELIVRQLGLDYLQETFKKLGLQDTLVSPDGFRLTSRSVTDDNMTSPRDMAYLLEKIYHRDLVSPEASDQMLDILKHQKMRDRLPRYLPTGWMIAHKTGLLRKACHDVGIVFSPRGDYMICVLTSKDRTYKNAKQFIASLGRITYDYYQGGFHKPIQQTRRDLVRNTRAS